MIQCLCEFDIKSLLFTKRKGSKSFEINFIQVDIYQDLSLAKFEFWPELLEGFYLVVVFNGKMVLLLRGMRKEAFKKTNVTLSFYNVISITKKEHIFVKKLYDTKAQFQDNDQNYNISIECDKIGANNPCLAIYIDSKMVMQVKHL